MPKLNVNLDRKFRAPISGRTANAVYYSESPRVDVLSRRALFWLGVILATGCAMVAMLGADNAHAAESCPELSQLKAHEKAIRADKGANYDRAFADTLEACKADAAAHHAPIPGILAWSRNPAGGFDITLAPLKPSAPALQCMEYWHGDAGLPIGVAGAFRRDRCS